MRAKSDFSKENPNRFMTEAEAGFCIFNFGKRDKRRSCYAQVFLVIFEVRPFGP